MAELINDVYINLQRVKIGYLPNNKPYSQLNFLRPGTSEYYR